MKRGVLVIPLCFMCWLTGCTIDRAKRNEIVIREVHLLAEMARNGNAPHSDIALVESSIVTKLSQD